MNATWPGSTEGDTLQSANHLPKSKNNVLELHIVFFFLKLQLFIVRRVYVDLEVSSVQLTLLLRASVGFGISAGFTVIEGIVKFVFV